VRGPALLLAVLLAQAAGAAPEEPLGYRMEDYRGPVPETLEGARVVDTAAAHALWQAGEAVFIDVLPRPPRPEGLPEGTIWRPTPRRSIPGAIWLPNVGYGGLAAETDSYFRRALADAAADRDTPVLFFSLAECWMSWNAAKRALWEYGYERVYWYPSGTDGWAAGGHPLERLEPEPR